METVVIVTWIGMLIAALMNPTPTTTVVLVENGKAQNAIVVETKAGSIVVDKPGGYVNINSKNEKPSEINIMSEEKINSKFKSAIESTPLKPIHVLLYFKSGSNELTQSSKDKLPQILKSIKERMPCDVNVIGHTDTAGSKKYNEKLSLQRANSVKKWINLQNIDLIDLKVETYGETDLLVKTADNVSEKKNRRVELLIR
ncbi:OmpA family protein [Sulfurospirillum arcachonense]|uniref:OmpA family protein n=1 Tax=Sulfurospirillum arcachonense TaxID=57666 RepID=UPI0004685FC1|nr:OmpA family protein [Sulfurospirillum arcachonense]